MQTTSRSLGFLFFISVSFFFVALTFWLISDVEAGWHACKFDEKFVFIVIQGLFEQPSLTKTFHQLIYGGPYIFGRITYYIPLLLSFIPAQIYGDPGQLIGTRFAESLILLAVYFLLVLSFIKTWHFRALTLIALFSLPYTQYFTYVSKPEMILLLNLFFFLLIYIKKGPQNYWSWFFLGLAYGAKVSLLPFVLFIFTITIFILYKDFETKRVIQSFLISCIIFILGLCLAAPTIIVHPHNYINIFLNKGIQSSFEDSSVDFFEWMHYIFTTYFYPSSYVLGGLFCVGILAICIYGTSFFTQHGFIALLKNKIIIFMMTGLSFILPPMLFITRKLDRGHYLHIGFIFLWISIVMLIECIENLNWQKKQKKVLQALLFIGIFSALLPQMWGSISYSKKLANETKSPSFLVQRQDFALFDNFVRKLNQKKRRPITVNYDPSLLRVHPYKSQAYIHPYYNFSTPHAWGKGYDLTYSSIGRSNYPERLRELPKTMARHQMFANEYAGFKKHVIGQSPNPAPPVYKELDIGLKKARLWMKISE